MAQGYGYNAWIGFASSLTLGTLAVRTKFLDILTESLTYQPTRTRTARLGSPSQSINTELGRVSGGSFEIEGNYEGMDTLFRYGFGAVASALDTTNAYNHTFTLSKLVPTSAANGVGLSIEVNRDVTAFLYEACKVNQIEVTQDVNAYTRIRFDVLGRNETRDTASSPTFPSELPMHQSQFTFTVDAAATTVNNFTWTLNNNLAHFPQLGSLDSKEIARNGKREVTFSFEIDFEDQTQLNNFMNLSDVALVALWTGPAISGGSSSNRFRISMPKCNFEGSTPTATAAGKLRMQINGIALEQTRAAQDECTLIIENTATSVA